jgi:hypothetical protein
MTPSDVFEWNRQNALDAWRAGTDPSTYGMLPAGGVGGSTMDMLHAFIAPTGEPTELGQRFSLFPGAFVGASGGGPASAPPGIERYAGLPLTAEQLGIPGLLERVSTRVPTVKAAGDVGHNTATLHVDLASAAGDPVSFERNGAIVSRYGTGFRIGDAEQPPFMRVAPGSTPQELHDQLVEHVAGNLRWLWDQAPDIIKQRAPLWYDGARVMADDIAAKTGLLPRQVAGGIAVMSPATEWNMNNARFGVTLNSLLNEGSATLTPAMRAYGQQDVASRLATGKKGQIRLAGEIQNMLDQDGTRLADLPDRDAAWFVRYLQQVHNPDQLVMNLSPEGQSLGPVTVKSGKPAAFSWGPTDHIENAISILRDPSLYNISQRVGAAHKVRSFYNNIVAPHAPFGDLTNDTHAIAAGQLMPLGQDDVIVGHGLGGEGSSSGVTGVQGLYPAYADAYRRVASELGLLPRQLQSILWETGRGLFSPSAKRLISLRKDINGVWSDYAAGRTTADEARSAVRSLTGPIQLPPWAVSGP